MKKNTPKTTKLPNNENSTHIAQTEYLREVSRQVEMALTSPDTAQPVKDCLKTIIGEASSAADLPMKNDFNVREGLPKIIANLNDQYGGGILHSIAAIIRHDTKAFEDYYAQNLDEQPKAAPPPTVNERTALTEHAKEMILRNLANSRIQDIASTLIVYECSEKQSAELLLELFEILVKASPKSEASMIAENSAQLIFKYSQAHDEAFDRWRNEALKDSEIFADEIPPKVKPESAPLNLSACAPENLNTRISELSDAKDLACALSGVLKNPLLPASALQRDYGRNPVNRR